MKIAVFLPNNGKIVEQNTTACEIQMYTGDSYEVFKNLYKDVADYLFFLIPGCNIVDTNLIDRMIMEIEDGVAIYYNYFVQIETPKSKILSFFDTYNKQKVLSRQKVIQTPILVQSKFVKDFSFNNRLKHLHNFTLLLALTDRCMLKRSRFTIDGIQPIEFDITHDLKILNEQSSS